MIDCNFLKIGKIVGIHGIKGNLKVFSNRESFDFFCCGNKVVIKRADGIEKYYRILWSKPHKKNLLVLFENILSRNDAKKLLDAEVFIEKSMLPELDKDDYYWFQIIGLDVYNEEGEYIGKVNSIIPTGSNDVYEVKDSKDGNEILIPAIESVVKSIDIEKKTMTVNLLEGL